jgi:hypothetical protein
MGVSFLPLLLAYANSPNCQVNFALNVGYPRKIKFPAPRSAAQILSKRSASKDSAIQIINQQS